MAIFIPNGTQNNFNGSYGEKKVYEALSTLNNQYTVFYSLNWIGINENRSIGEADFVILHPEKGLLVIEVKSGEIEYKNGEWFQTNTRTRISTRINPFIQARKSQFEIMDRLQQAKLGFKLPIMCYCVWFPSIEISNQNLLPPESPKEIVLDKLSLDNPNKNISECFNYWAKKYTLQKLNSSQFQKIILNLCPHFHVVPKLKTRIGELEESYIQLTKQQIVLLDFLEEQKMAVIHGLAGTGKTVIAMEKAKRLALKQEKILFLCFNSFLRDMLRSNNKESNIIIHNAHSLALEIMGKSNNSIENIISEFEEYLEVVCESQDWKYKNIIVDEGQDLDDRLLNKLYELVKGEHGCFYVFYDRNQYIMGNHLPNWINEAECKLVLQKNCRNTAEIYKTSCSMMGFTNINHNDIHGDKPILKLCNNNDEQNIIVDTFIKNMIKEGLMPEDVVILTAKSLEKSSISPNKKYGNQYISTTRESGKILFTTIRKFKGLEAEAVIIVDVSISSLILEESRRLLYVGASRAKYILNIAMVEDVKSDDMKNIIENFAPNRNIPKNKNGLKRLLKML